MPWTPSPVLRDVAFFLGPKMGERRLVLTLLLLGSMVDKMWVAGGLEGDLPVEVSEPADYVALGGSELRLRYRLGLGTEDEPGPSSALLALTLSFVEEDGTEVLVGSVGLPALPATNWNEAQFECGVVVRGGTYSVGLVDSSPANSSRYYMETTARVRVSYPTIDFDVPSRLETYTTPVRISFGLTRSLCRPLSPLPPTILLLARAPTLLNEISRDSPILENPLSHLQREGRVSVTVECHLWARNGTYRVEIREQSFKQKIIAKSEPITVDWSSRFGLNFSRQSVIPCRGNFRLSVSFPPCVLPGKDRVRLYGYEHLPVPSHLVPKRLSYVSEKRIGTGRGMAFSCALFPQRFSQYCFQYVNTAEDESVAIVLESCLPTFSPEDFTDGGWGPWSSWSECSASCGAERRRFRYRFCDSPPPSFGANFCQGSSIEEDPCEDGPLPECFPGSPNENPAVITSPALADDYDEYKRSNGLAGPEEGPSPRPRLHLNDSATAGCECGCLLHDLVPGPNYSLRISLSPNHSACEDEDEEEHHNLKWILHTRGDGDRIRFSIVEADVQCVTVSFRDGNTTDSNLLEVMRTSRQAQEDDQAYVMMTIESTGGSLSIAASDDSSLLYNCSAPSVYFFAFYKILPAPPAEPPDSAYGWSGYNFWTFLLLKLVLTVFVLIALCSLFSGCATRVYKYKKLRWSRDEEYDPENDETDEEEGGGGGRRRAGDGDEACLLEASSRATSVTLMSFDYAYWKQVRLRRLKCYLLRPRTLNLLTSRIKSFPNTPTHPKRPAPAGAAKASGPATRIREQLLLKSISLSDTNLESVKRRKVVGRDSDRARVTVNPTPEAGLSGKGITLLTCSPVTRPTTPRTSLKHRKEKLNLKRKDSAAGSGRRRKEAESGALLQQVPPSLHSSSEFCGNSHSDLNSMNDFEMDYYDYDILNAGAIPGSYLLEPAYPFWTESLYDDPPSDLGPNEIEMMSTSVGTSVGLFTPEPSSSSKEIGLKETSFDTFDSRIRFADEEEDEEDTRTISESTNELEIGGKRLYS